MGGYKILQGFSVGELTELVNRHLGDGWTVYGDLKVMPRPAPISASALAIPEFVFFQAVVRDT